MQDLVWYAPTKVLCAPGALYRFGTLAAKIGKRLLAITDDITADSEGFDKVRGTLENQGIEVILFCDIDFRNPEESYRHAVDLAEAGRVLGIVGFGGIKALSFARLVSLGVKNPIGYYDILDGVPLKEAALPYMDVPGTCRYPFLLTSGYMAFDDRQGKSVVGTIPNFYPTIAVMDPGVYASLSTKFRLATLVDTFLSAVEGYFSKKSTFYSDTLFLRAAGLILSVLSGLIDEPDNSEYLFKTTQAGFFTASGLVTSFSGVGIASSYVLSSKKMVPKAIVSTILLPYILEYGLRVCPEKVSRMGPMLGENISGLSVVAAADRVVESIRASIGIQQLPVRLSELGINNSDLASTAEDVQSLPMAAALPYPLSVDDVYELLKQAY